MFKRILHPSDFSPASHPAFTKAVEAVRAARGSLLVVHVMTPAIPVPADGHVPPRAWEEMERSLRTHSQRRLDSLVAKARKAGVRASGLLLEGAPAQRIVEAARSSGPTSS